MSDAVQQRCRHALLAEDLRPLAELQVRGDDDRSAFVPFAEEVEERLGAFAAEADIAHLVDHDDIRPIQLALQAAVEHLSLGLHDGGGQRFGRKEAHPLAPAAGLGPQRNGAVGLADSGVAHQDHPLGLLDPVALGQLQQALLVDPGGRREVEALQALHDREARMLHPHRADVLLPLQDFLLGQRQQVALVGQVARGGLLGHLGIVAGDRR